MRNPVTQTFTSNGRQVEVTLFQDPNVDDVLTSEAQVHAYVLATGDSGVVSRVSRELREALLRFGVQR